MSRYTLYDYLDSRGLNDFESWSKSLEKGYLARLNRQLKALEDNGPDLIPGMLFGPITGYRHIYKLKIGHKLALRPLLCRGPLNNDSEFTLLLGAIEKGWKWDPRNAPEIAEARRVEIINNPRRRCGHVKVI